MRDRKLVVAGLIARESGEVLITQRTDAQASPLFWEFPGGKIEPGEAPEVALKRELHEELGIRVAVLDAFDALVHHYPDRSIDLRFFRCRWLQHEPQPLGCETLAWAGRGELGGYDFPAADARLLERLAQCSWDWDSKLAE